MAVLREQHRLRRPHPTKGGHALWRIQNWMNFKEEGGQFAAANPGLDVATGTPEDWPGSFDYLSYSQRGPIQVACGLDSALRPHVHLRIAERRSIHFKFVWLGGGDATFEQVDRRNRFQGYWPQTRLTARATRRGYSSSLRLVSAGHPESFRYQLRLAPGMSYAFGGERVVLFDSEGLEVASLPPPVGHDSSTVAPTDDGTQLVRASVVQAADRNGHPTFRWVLNQDDLDAAVYPVVIS